MKRLLKDIFSGVLNVVKRFVLTLASTLGVIAVFGIILEKLETVINTKLYRSLGSFAVLFTAAIGTPLHETAHWLICKLFGFKIHDVELLRPVAFKQDGILGYVSYSYDKESIWQNLGCFFSGMAPILLGVIFIVLAVRLIKPEVVRGINEEIKKSRTIVSEPSFFVTYSMAFIAFWKNMFKKEKHGILRGIICLYIICSISMHMTLSPQDITASLPGLGILLGLYLIYSIITALIGTDYKVHMAKAAAFIAAFLSIGLVADLVMLIPAIIL